MNGRRTAIGFTLVAAGSLAILWLSNLPLGVPGEWDWDRIPVAPRRMDRRRPGLARGRSGRRSLYRLRARRRRRVEGAPRWQVAGWLAGLTLGGFAWLWVVQDSPADPAYGMAKTGWVLYFRGTEGYFDQARYVMRDVPSYLAGYEQVMAQGDVLHLGTHPPGLMLFHRACIKLCESSPLLRDFLLRTQPASFREALDQTEELNRGSPRELTPSDRAALWLAALVTQALAAATLIPIYLLVARDHSRTVAWLTAALWPLIPALAVFLPKSDALLPFFGALFLWVWLEGFRLGRLGLCCLAGAILWLSMFLSLAILPIGAAAALLTIWEGMLCSRSERSVVALRDWALRIGAAAIGWAIPVVALAVFFKLNLLRVWSWNYHNHAGFYQQNVRTYWLWLIANPIEFAFALGTPTRARGHSRNFLSTQIRLASTSGRTSLVSDSRLAVAVALRKKHGRSGPALADCHALARLAGGRLLRGVFRDAAAGKRPILEPCGPCVAGSPDDRLPGNGHAGHRISLGLVPEPRLRRGS